MGGATISPQIFQMVVGLYTVEIAVLLSLFVNRVEYGEDVIGERSTMYQMVIVSIIVYSISWLLVYSMFGGPISMILGSGIT